MAYAVSRCVKNTLKANEQLTAYGVSRCDVITLKANELLTAYGVSRCEVITLKANEYLTAYGVSRCAKNISLETANQTQFFVFERLVANRNGIQALPKLYGVARLDVGFLKYTLATSDPSASLL